MQSMTVDTHSLIHDTFFYNISRYIVSYYEYLFIFRDALLISIVNSSTSIFAGFVIFAIVGNMAALQGKKVPDVASQG